MCYYNFRLKNQLSEIEALIVSRSEFSSRVARLPRWVYSIVALKTVAAVRNGKPKPMLAVKSFALFSN